MDEEAQNLRDAGALSGRPSPRVHWSRALRPIEAVICVLGLLMAMALLADFRQSSRLNTTTESILHQQAEAKVRAQRSRAVTCDLNKALGAAEPIACQDPEIQPYRDPKVAQDSATAVAASLETQRLICALLDRLTTEQSDRVALPEVLRDELCEA